MATSNQFYSNYSHLVGDRMDVVTEKHAYNVPRRLSNALCVITGFDAILAENRSCVESYERDMIALSTWTHNLMCDEIASWCDAATPYLAPDMLTIKLTLTEASHIAGCLHAWLNQDDYEYQGLDIPENVYMCHIQELAEIFPLLDLNEDEDKKDKLHDWWLI